MTDIHNVEIIYHHKCTWNYLNWNQVDGNSTNILTVNYTKDYTNSWNERIKIKCCDKYAKERLKNTAYPTALKAICDETLVERLKENVELK